MLLAIDIGNTNITLGLYTGETLGPRWRLATDHNRMPDEYGITLVHLFQHTGHSPADAAEAGAVVQRAVTLSLAQRGKAWGDRLANVLSNAKLTR